jgi:hypothetical protein
LGLADGELAAIAARLLEMVGLAPELELAA